jgi:hypothetical protein
VAGGVVIGSCRCLCMIWCDMGGAAMSPHELDGVFSFQGSRSHPRPACIAGTLGGVLCVFNVYFSVSLCLFQCVS